MSVMVHQALHGYSEGHRQLACSTSLSPKDARLLLVMSDVAGPGVASTGLAYLTGYPLADSGMYALAMTWPAPEMPRPGCVWTHTLLISFADLALMDVPSALASLFSRPENHRLDGYDEGLTVDSSPQFREQLNGVGAKCVALFASALYGHPTEQIWSRRPSAVEVDDVVLRIWDQQWPRLRRSFKFCTLTSRDRSQDALKFDLQLTMGTNSSSQLRFASNLDGVEATEVKDEVWLADLVRDAVQPGRSSLRHMLRLLGGDVLGGREAMSPICTLHAFLEEGSPQALGMAVSVATQISPLSASEMAKGMVLRALLDSVLPLKVEQILGFVLEHFGMLSEAEAAERAGSMARLVWKADPRVFVVTSYDGAEPVRQAIRRGVSSVDLETVLEELPTLTDLAEPLLHLFPDLAQDYRFWAQTQSWPSSIAAVGIDISGPAVLRAMVAGLRDEGAINSALHVAGTAAVLTCLEDLVRKDYPVAQLHGWIRQACVDVHGVAKFLSRNGQHSSELLVLLCSVLSPDAVPNDYGDDPWLIALSSLWPPDGALPVELAAYGFRRALGWRSRSIEPLLRLTFEPLHEAAVREVVAAHSWNLLEGVLPWVSSNDAWDKGLRLRRAVAKKFVDLPIGPRGFIQFVQSDQLFCDLLEAVWHFWSGGRYLRTVKDWLDHSTDSSLALRRRMVKNFIKGRSYF